MKSLPSIPATMDCSGCDSAADWLRGPVAKGRYDLGVSDSRVTLAHPRTSFALLACGTVSDTASGPPLGAWCASSAKSLAVEPLAALDAYLGGATSDRVIALAATG
jgi:hypothetical protein